MDGPNYIADSVLLKGLYNGVKPPEEGDRKIEGKNKKEELL